MKHKKIKVLYAEMSLKLSSFFGELMLQEMNSESGTYLCKILCNFLNSCSCFIIQIVQLITIMKHWRTRAVL